MDKDEVNRNFKTGKFHLTKSTVGYYPTFKLKEDLSINMHDSVYSAVLRSEPFSAINEIPVTVNITDGHLAEIEKREGYNWLVLLERIDGETAEIQ